jgi:hypothetical protein
MLFFLNILKHIDCYIQFNITSKKKLRTNALLYTWNHDSFYHFTPATQTPKNVQLLFFISTLTFTTYALILNIKNPSRIILAIIMYLTNFTFLL